MRDTAILLVSCPYRTGLVARIGEFIFRHGGNILDFDQQRDVDASEDFAGAYWRVPRGRISNAGCTYGSRTVVFE